MNRAFSSLHRGLLENSLTVLLISAADWPESLDKFVIFFFVLLDKLKCLLSGCITWYIKMCIIRMYCLINQNVYYQDVLLDILKCLLSGCIAWYIRMFIIRMYCLMRGLTRLKNSFFTPTFLATIISICKLYL